MFLLRDNENATWRETQQQKLAAISNQCSLKQEIMPSFVMMAKTVQFCVMDSFRVWRFTHQSLKRVQVEASVQVIELSYHIFGE